MGKIIWDDRTDRKTATGADYEWSAAIANAVKDSVNVLYVDKKTWYVSKGGDNSKIGSTRAEPYQTITKAMSVMAAGDVLELLGGADVTAFDEDLTIPARLTSLTIKGPVPNAEGGPRMTIDGTWNLDGNNIYFNNLDVAVTWDRSTDFNLTCSNCKMSSPFTDRLAILALNNCFWTVHATTHIKSLILNNCTLVGNNTVNINTFFRSHHADIVGSISAGLIASSDIVLRNTSITGNLTIIGNLDQENSTIKGSTTVSGTKTITSQADDKLDRLSTSNQGVASNVEFEGQVTVSGVTISFTATPTFDFDTKPGGNVQKMILTSNVTTLTIANELPAGSYRVYLTEDGTGGYTIPTPDSSWGTEMNNSASFETGADAINLIDIAVDPDGNKLFSINTKS